MRTHRPYLVYVIYKGDDNTDPKVVDIIPCDITCDEKIETNAKYDNLWITIRNTHANAQGNPAMKYCVVPWREIPDTLRYYADPNHR